jgi:hypothetical protein
MKTYLKIYLSHNDYGHRTAFLTAIKEAVVCQIVEDGDDVLIDVLSDDDLMHESFTLGILFIELRKKYGVLNPYLWELVHVDEEEFPKQKTLGKETLDKIAESFKPEAK